MITDLPAIKNIGKTVRTCVSKTARALNRIAIQELKADKVVYTYPKASIEDLTRLTSKTLEDSYKRVTWVNPDDGKVYHLLETGRENGMINVRILDRDGAHVKDAKIKPKNIVVFDQFESLGFIKNLLKFRFHNNISHGEIVETYLKRNNPFANVIRINHKNFFEMLKYRGKLPPELAAKKFEQLNERMNQGEQVDFVSISDAIVVDIKDLKNIGAKAQKDFINEHGFDEEDIGLKNALSKITQRGIKVFSTAGNQFVEPENKVNILLAIDGVEGVGAIAKTPKGVKLARASASRNSEFTQHYELGGFKGEIVEENGKILGINITGKDGVDLPYNKKNKSLLRRISGTSYSAPIRVAKLALNDMMAGIL